MNELIEAQKKYIEYLEYHVGKLAVFSSIHGQVITHQEYLEGEDLRNNIKRLTK